MSSQSPAEPRGNFVAISLLKAVALSGEFLLSIIQSSDSFSPSQLLAKT